MENNEEVSGQETNSKENSFEKFLELRIEELEKRIEQDVLGSIRQFLRFP